jgi:hypothetical protein
MQKWLKSIFPLLAVAFLGWGFSGCLVSGIFTLDYPFDHDISTSSNPTLDSWDKVFVDLNDIDTYKDHKGNLKGIETVCIIMDVKNNLNQNVSGEIWISYDEYGSKPEVMQHGTRIFSGIALGPNEERHFECGDIQDILENLNAFEAAIKVGQFWVYGFGNEETYDVTFSHIVLLIALAAGL